MTMVYHLLDLFSGRRGRDHDLTGDRDIGRVISRHRTRRAAEREAAAVLRGIRRGHGPSAYLPLSIVACDRRLPIGLMVTEDMLLRCDDDDSLDV